MNLKFLWLILQQNFWALSDFKWNSGKLQVMDLFENYSIRSLLHERTFIVFSKNIFKLLFVLALGQEKCCQCRHNYTVSFLMVTVTTKHVFTKVVVLNLPSVNPIYTALKTCSRLRAPMIAAETVYGDTHSAWSGGGRKRTHVFMYTYSQLKLISCYAYAPMLASMLIFAFF